MIFSDDTTGAVPNPADLNADVAIPDHASYLHAADLHQQAGTGTSIFDPTTWGERAANGLQFGAGMLIRATASTYNAGVTVGKLVGVADDSDEANTHNWMSAVDDDLAAYYDKNQSSIDTWGDVAGMMVPGMGGIKAFNLAQKGIAIATKGRAGLTMAYNFGTLPTKGAEFAAKAAAEMTSTTNPFTLINANLAKSLGAEFGQQYLEMAAFTVASESTMRQSPLFSEHDAGDILSNALTAGGFIGGGILTTVAGAKTIRAIHRAGKEVDAATHEFRTVSTEVMEGTPASERLAVHVSNIAELPEVDAADILAKQKSKAVANTQLQEVNNARNASHELAGSDVGLGNHFADVMLTADASDVANKVAGITSISRAGVLDAADASTKLVAAEGKAAKSAEVVSKLGDKLEGISVGTTEYAAVESKLAEATAKHAEHLGEVTAIHETPAATDFLNLRTGLITSEAPTLRIADKAASAEEAAVVVRKFKHKQEQTGFEVGGRLESIGEDGIEARYITAQHGEFDITEPVGAQDLPYMERAWTELGSTPSGTVTLSDGRVMSRSDLFHEIVDVKAKLADSLVAQAEIAGKEYNQATLAKILNTSEEFVVGDHSVRNPGTDFFRMQSDAIAFTEKQVAAGLWSDAKGTMPIWDKPTIVRCNRDTAKVAVLTGHDIDGITALKQEQILYREAADRVFANFDPEMAAKYVDRIPAAVLATANRSSVGRSLTGSMDGDYKQLSSYVQQMGAVTAEWKSAALAKLADGFAPSGSKLLTDPASGTEFWKVTQQLRQTPEQYRLVADYTGDLAVDGAKSHLVNTKQLDWEAAGSDPEKLPTFEDAKAPVVIPLHSDGMHEFAKEWDASRQVEQTHRANLRAAQGVPFKQENITNFYLPGVDAKRFPFYAYVVDDSLTSTGHVSMIHANTAADLEALTDKVPTDGGLRVIFDKQSADYHKAARNYDYSLAINENYIDTALKRTGAAAPFQPVTDPKVLWEEVMNWRKNQATGLINEMVSHKFCPEFNELRRQGELYDLANTSTKGYISDKLQKYKANPYTDYIAAALYEEPSGGAPIWDAVNRLAETSVSTISSKLADTWKTAITAEDLGKVNEHLASIGCNVFTDAATHMLANHSAPKPALASFVRGMNGILSTLMLRTDPMNAMANGLGHTVLYGAEMRGLLASIGEEGRLVMPGTKDTIISPVKLAASAYGDWFSKVLGGADGGKLHAECEALGLLPSYTKQYAQIVAEGTLTGAEQSADLYSRTDRAFAAAKDIMAKTGNVGEKLSGNRFAEEMNRFVSGVTAIHVCDAAIAAGKLDPALKPSIVNTFVNRVEGVSLAKQRPLLFRGPVGQAVGLFQTYQFNMLQQLFRHVGEGDTKSTALLLGLQGGMFGMNGLPAFNAMNQYLVGNSSGNTNHMDTITATYGAAGKEVGDWLLYGAASNMLLHPDAKVNLYSRGDINPRQVTVIPTNIADVPIVGATTKLFSSMYGAIQQMDKGADKWEAFIKGVQHSGVSRPLTGFAQVLEGVGNGGKVITTDNGNNIVMENDLMTIMSASRLLGAKPLDEAVATDAFHRVQTYRAASMAQIENLGAGIKATVSGGGVPDEATITGFAHEYAKAGGKQQQFAAFYSRQVLNADKSKVNQMIDSSNSASSQYMQKVMGGYTIEDYANSGGGAGDITGEER